MLDINELHFEEFIEICSDSGLIGEEEAREIINFAKAIGGVGAVPRLTGEQLNSSGDFTASLVSIYPSDMTFNNYVTTDENYYATEIARTIALIPRVWKSITPVMLHASTGQGKTHLLAAIARATHKRTLILNTVDLHIEYQHCLNAGIDRELRDWITSYDLLMLDDIQFSQGDLQFQKFLISVINRMPRGKHGLITSSDVHPSDLLDLDKSFYSRLTSGLIMKLETVDLDGRREILMNLFGETGIKPAQEVVDFIAERVIMNVRQLKAAGRMVMAHMLGPSHDVTLDTVDEILKFMQIYKIETDRPKASKVNVQEKSTVEPSPYIVVDIDEESTTEKGRVETTPSVSGRTAEEVVKHLKVEGYAQNDEEDPDLSAEETASELDDHIFREETGEISRTEEETETNKYRSMVESADTVDSQIEALKQAVSDRIEQLEGKHTDSREVDKLRFALEFLNQGKLESAMLALRPK